MQEQVRNNEKILLEPEKLNLKHSIGQDNTSKAAAYDFFER